MQASDRVLYGPKGSQKPMDRLSYERLKSQNLMVRSTRFGSEKADITLLQGIGGAAASGGTHATGGCYDTTAFNWKNRQYTGRLLGGADWHRAYNWDNRGGGEHIHFATIGVGYAAGAAKRQWTAYYAGRNGLANNAKDPGPRLSTKPLFVAPWTDRGARGVFYLKKGYTAREEGSTKAKSLGAIPVGAKFTVAARVNVGGTLWAINIDGKHLPASVLSKTKPTSPSKPTTPTKPPTEKKAVTLHVGTINVIRWRLGKTNVRGVQSFQKGLNYRPDRVKGFAKMQDQMGVSIFCTQESGQYADADAISDALGNGWKNVLHGDAAGDITQAVHWHPKRKVKREGVITTLPAAEVAYHNTGTWTHLEDVGSGTEFLVVAPHSEYRPRGATKASKYDKLREKHTADLIKQAEKIAGGLPIVFAGDFNQDADDAYDGVGRAFKAAGYVDTYEVATGKSGPETTTNSLDPKKVKGRRLDRIFVKKGTKVGDIITVPGYPYTDHNGVGVELTLVN